MNTKNKKKGLIRFGIFKIIATGKVGRGIGGNPNDTVEAFEPHWDEFQEKLEDNDELANDMKEYFN